MDGVFSVDQQRTLAQIEYSVPEIIGDRSSLFEGCWVQQCSAFEYVRDHRSRVRDYEVETLDEFVEWDAPVAVRLVPRALLAAMKVRAFPERDKSHKRLKDLADLHALVWYGSTFNQLRQQIDAHLTEDDITQFKNATTDDAFVDASRLIAVDETVLRNSIQQLFV